MVGHWLHQLGHEAHVVEGGIGALRGETLPVLDVATLTELASVAPGDITEGAKIVDVRASAAYREGHVAGARWSIRPRLDRLGLAAGDAVVLVADDAGVATLAAERLRQLGAGEVRRLAGGPGDWRGAGLEVVATPDEPGDGERIDFLFFTHARRTDEAHSRQYLAWEIGLVDQLDDQERAGFRIAAG